jgi:hypothetical protein
MRRFALLLAALLALACGTAWAEDFTLPGLEADASAYQNSLTAHFPAGGTPQARRQTEQAAAAATRKQDWASAAAAWETRIGQGEATPAQWMALAEAQMHRMPPQANRALQAAWQNFSASDAGAAEVPSLLLMAAALKVLNRPAQAIQALEAAAERSPDDKTILQTLDETRRAAGILVRRARGRAATRMHRLHRGAGPAGRFPCRRLGAARSARSRRCGDARRRSDMRVGPSVGWIHPDHVASRHAG